MTKQEFKNVTKDCFKNYGFIINKNTFLLDLPELIFAVFLDKSNFGEYYYINFNFSIKQLHSEIGDIKNAGKWDNLDLAGHSRFTIFPADSPHYYQLHYENLCAIEYKEALSAFLATFFEPVKKHGLKHMKTFLDSKDYIFIPTEQAKEFLQNY